LLPLSSHFRQKNERLTSASKRTPHLRQGFSGQEGKIGFRVIFTAFSQRLKLSGYTFYLNQSIMKPKVFLSHSKSDKKIIKKLADDLRSCTIESWYDEWEIPPGGSIKKKIFEDGIPDCDAFFIYLTKESTSSYWVEKELDAAVFREAESNQSIILPFVSKDDIRDKLPLDLKSVSCPVLNEDNYIIPFGKIISKVWQVFYQKKEQELKSKNQNTILKLENNILKLESKIKSNSVNNLSFDQIKEKLETNYVVLFDTSYPYLDVLNTCKSKLASGTTVEKIEEYIRGLNFSSSEDAFQSYLTEDIYDPLSIAFDNKTKFNTPYEKLKDVIGDFIIWGLIIMEPNDQADYAYLTERGKDTLRKL
jgi:hypothetical protein